MIGQTKAHLDYAKYMTDIVKTPQTVTNAENDSFSEFIKNKGKVSRDKIEMMEKPIDEKWYQDHPKTRGLE